jgi:CO/xanthine dehydrogenase FAD-binding subunit
MRAALSTLAVIRPRSLDEALAAMAGDDRPVPLAGGTDLFVGLNAGTLEARRFLDLSPLRALRGIRADARGITLGALATFAEIREHAAIRRRLPSLAAAAAEIGAWGIQHRATIGGNIANASPAGDSLPVLLAHDAVVIARSASGARGIPCATLFTGYRTLALRSDELIEAVRIPFPAPRTRMGFRKVGTRRAQSISKVVFCGALALDRRGHVATARLAFGSMAPVPLRARASERALEGRDPIAAAAAAIAALGEHLVPIDDVRSEARYRSLVAGRLLARFLGVPAPATLLG